ncbi:MAG: hypothetical protein Kow00102_16370 [Spirochaetota bacterium]
MEEILPDDYEKSINTIVKHLTPEGCIPMSKDALRGYMFGLGIMPYEFPFEEWIPPIFGEKMPKFDSLRQQNLIFSAFEGMLNRYVIGFEEGGLEFPYDYNPFNPGVKYFNNIKEWCKGFLQATSFAPDFWYCDEDNRVSKASQDKDELSFDYEEFIISNVMLLLMISRYEDYHDELKSIINQNVTDRKNKKLEKNIEIKENFLKRELLKIFHETYYNLLLHARTQYLEIAEGMINSKNNKIGRNDPCPCGSGKKYKKCCGKNN